MSTLLSKNWEPASTESASSSSSSNCKGQGTGLTEGADATGSPIPIVVQKYGGSSVATPERLRQVAEHVAQTQRSGVRVVVVVSAMGKTTDELIALAKSVSENPSRRELDMLLSCGERISMALLAMALSELGVRAISFTGSQSGILTNDRHSGARIIEVRPVRIQDELERDYVVIVAGFQGMSYKREITTLGRGGSDTTAVALAAALSASHCEIYSDVDGVYSADPRVVPQAQHIPTIGYAEMQELAAHGAKVLNAQAVEWAQRAGIVIHARKTQPQRQAAAARETQVGAVPSTDSPPDRREHRATAVTSTLRLVQVSTPKNGADVLSVLRNEGVELRDLQLDLDDGQVLWAAFVRDDLPDFSRTVDRLQAAAGGALRIDESCGSVTAVGPSLGTAPQVLLSVHSGLRSSGLHAQRYRQSGLRISVYLPTAEVASATQILHDLLCAPPQMTGA